MVKKKSHLSFSKSWRRIVIGYFSVELLLADLCISIRLTCSIFTVVYSSLHLKAFCKWVNFVVASEHQMSSEQEHHVKQPVLFLFYSCHLSYRKTLKFSFNRRNRCGGIPFTKISYLCLFPFSSSNTIQVHVMCNWLDFFS